jgi:hypothetical protein
MMQQVLIAITLAIGHLFGFKIKKTGKTLLKHSVTEQRSVEAYMHISIQNRVYVW